MPRNEGVRDGLWGQRDATLVAAATNNEAAKPARKARFSEHGESGM